MESSNPLLRRYRSDRRKLLEFLVSSAVIKEITTPEGPTASVSNIEFDSLSTDYVLECIQTGGVLDVSQAAKKYNDDSSHPITRRLKSGDAFYLCSHPDSAGSPPRRVPPPITMNQGVNKRNVAESCNSMNHEEATAPYTNSLINTHIPSVGLPTLKTGLRDDDLRESAYEVLLGCMMFSRFEILPPEVRKREKSPKFLSGLKSRKEKRHIEPESSERHLKLLDTIRVQMQISVAADEFIRRRLTQCAAGKGCRQFDVPQLALVLLTGLLKSDFPSEKSYLYWKNRQANVLEELVCSDHKKSEKQMIEASLAKIRNPTEWDVKMSPSERSNVLLTLRQVALTFSSLPERFGLEGETYYWTNGYHLNIRLYEKLLFGVFDILEESQFIEEAEEILKLVKLTWSMLGITSSLHHALFAWVLFQQFVATEEAVLLDYAIREVEHVLTAEVYDDKELAYMKSLTCSNSVNGCESRMNLLQCIFSSICSWCDSKLQDYHLYFSQKSSFFERVLRMGLSTGTRGFIPHGNIQFTGSCPDEIATKKIRNYVEKTLDAACERVSSVTTIGSTKDRTHVTHPLAILASELKFIAEKDLSVFSPVLQRWYPDCATFSAKKLHQFYGARLKPFIKDITCFTEDVKKVLPAAYELEHCLIKLSSSACKDNNFHHDQEFEHYPIAEVSKSIILDWVVAQHERILEWTGRAFDLEDWEPLSSQQKHAASAVEVFRIIEETVDQFFEWSLPMDITHLQALLSIIFHSVDAYLMKVVSQLVDKQKLYPSTPPLTRYKEATFPIVKKKVVVESFIMDDDLYKHLDELTASKLCIRLNTYRYIQKQITGLEEGIRKSWVSVASHGIDRHSTEKTPPVLEPEDVNGESVSELFVATLDCIRDSASHAIRKTSEFLGAKIVFWDMRDSFLSYLYYGGVEGNRLDGVFPQFDKPTLLWCITAPRNYFSHVLNDVCGVIDNTIRDLVVSSIWKASLEGFMWVLLDGGPSRAFSDSDISLIDEDFNMLKELFVADGEGLPRSLVEEQARSYRQILSLFSLQSGSLIKLLMASSEQISVVMNNPKYGQRYMGDAHTLIRVLCHKKDKEASRFLRRQYRLPSSSDYDENGVENSSLGSPFVADLLKKSASFRWSEKSHSSFRSMRKRFQESSWRR